MSPETKPDTSAEGLMSAPNRLRWWRGKVSNWLHRHEPIPRETPDGTSLADELGAAATEIERLRALADAAGQAAPVPHPVELETTDEWREFVLREATERPENFVAEGLSAPDVEALIGDVNRLLTHANVEHERAEGLAKEVERLKAENVRLDLAVARNEKYLNRAEAAEAKLALYEALLADGQVEKAVEIIEVMLAWASPANTPMADIKDKHSQTVGLLRRLSVAKAESEGRDVENIAISLSDMIIDWVDGGELTGTDWRAGLRKIIELRLSRLFASAALAPASEERS